ncbi:MAG: hypothetical protein DRI54_02820 [Bacteroidetes bacterium]|nr:MAG: hypothetical protein DRI54_02820 [Bacteroidota bacterium]
MKKFWLNIIVIFSIAIASSACSRKTEIVKPQKLQSKSPKYLIKKLNANEQDFEYLFAKFTARTNINSKKFNFKGSIRIKSDSIIWLSFTKLGGVELVRIVLTQDSIKFINKWDKEYYTGKLSDLKDFGGINVEFKVLEDMLTGKPFDFDPEGKYKSSNDYYFYLLSSKAKSKVRKATQIMGEDSLLTFEMQDKKYDKAISKVPEDQLILKNYYLFPESFLLAKQSVSLIAQQQAIDIAYDNYEIIDDFYPFAFNQIIRIASKDKSSRLDIKYTSIKLNEQLEFPFKISKKYVPYKKE